MSWGQKIKIYTDHLNLTREALGATSDSVHCWRLLLEEFGPEIVYIKGIYNTVADAISRLDYTPQPKNGKSGKFPGMCHSAFMQPLADECDVDIHNLNRIIRWKAVSKCFINMLFVNACVTEDDKSTSCTYLGKSDIRSAFFHRGNKEQEEIYPRIVSEISDAQKSDKYLRKYFKWGGGGGGRESTW